MKNSFILTLFVMLISISSLHSAPITEFIRTYSWSDTVGESKFTLNTCKCDVEDSIAAAGFETTLYEPIGYKDGTNTPWNLVGLDTKFGDMLNAKQGSSRKNGKNRRYTHFLAFPIMAILNIVQDYACFERLRFASFLYWTEILPTQTNDIIALFTQASKGPFSKIWFNNPIGAAACVADCAKVATTGEPINALHWCVGCSGVTGNNTAYGNGKASDPITGDHVSAYSMIDDLHFAGAFSKTSNANFTFSPSSKIPTSMCTNKYFGMGIKTQYQLNLGGTPSTWDATALGDFRGKWAEFKNKPKTQDDVGYWVTIRKDFCMGAMKCKSFFTKVTQND